MWLSKNLCNGLSVLHLTGLSTLSNWNKCHTLDKTVCLSFTSNYTVCLSRDFDFRLLFFSFFYPRTLDIDLDHWLNHVTNHVTRTLITVSLWESQTVCLDVQVRNTTNCLQLSLSIPWPLFFPSFHFYMFWLHTINMLHKHECLVTHKWAFWLVHHNVKKTVMF